MDLTVLPENFKMSETRWDVEIRPGEKISLNGTIESVYAQLLELNPNYEADNAEQISTRLAKLEEETAAAQGKQLAKRDHTECWRLRPQVSRGVIEEGIRYLWRVGGDAWIQGGTCSRVNCSWNSAIGWCSYRAGGERWMSPGGFGWIGHAANVVVNDCGNPQGSDSINGQRYHDSHVAVTVDQSYC
ncbi:hypothetical protein RB594_002660 [Gaeumannomyces avenae]